MYNFKANSISTIVPKKVTEKYPQFEEFLRVYYEWQQKTTLQLQGTIGNVDFSDKLYGVETDLITNLEVSIDSNRKVLTEFEDRRTFIRGEVLIAYTEHSTPVEVMLNGEKNFLFNGELNPKITLYRGQTYRFENNTGLPLYIKDRKTTGANSAISQVTNNGASSGTLELTISDSLPRLLYYTTESNTNIGTLEINTIPAQLESDFRQSILEDVSVWGFSRIQEILFHVEYIYDNFSNIASINTPDAFFEQYLRDYGLESLFKDNFKARRAVNDFIRFFQKKGTEDAIKFFFRNFFQKDVSVSYPGELVLRASDSEYFIRKQLYVTATDKGIEFTRNRKIEGARSGATAIIEAYTFDAGRDFYKLYLDDEKIVGQFIIDEEIRVVEDDDSDIVYDTGGRVIGTVSDFDIIEPGSEYEVDQTITNTYTVAGEPLIVALRVVDITSSSINRLSIDLPGSGYVEGDELIFPKPEKKTQFYGITQPNGSGDTQYISHNIYIDLQDISEYTLNWDGAFVNISGVVYYIDSYDSGTGIIHLRTNVSAPTITSGKILNIYFPAQNVQDPYYDDEFFHPADNVGKATARAFVSSVTASGEIQTVDIQSNGAGYIRRPTTASGLVISTTSGNGAEISTIGQNFGGILEVESANDIIGTSFDIIITLQRDAAPADKDARIRFVSNSLSDYGNFFEGNEGFISDKIYIHDSYFYQDYSYVIESDLNFSDFAELYRKLAHPAGLIFFNQYFIINFFSQKLNDGQDTVVAPKTILIEKLPSSNDGIDFELITLQTLSKYITHLYYEQWLDEFRWRSENIISLQDVYGNDSEVTISSWATQTLESGTLIPRTFEESPIDHFRTTHLFVTISGTGLIDYSDTSTSGWSDFSTVSGSGTLFTQEASKFDIIDVGGESLLVYTINTNTELIAQRINTSGTITLNDEPFEITQKRKTELNYARTGDILQLGDVNAISGVADVPVISGLETIFLNT